MHVACIFHRFLFRVLLCFIYCASHVQNILPLLIMCLTILSISGMGNKLQYAMNPLIETTPNNDSFIVSTFNDRDCFQNKGLKAKDTTSTVLNRFEDSMDRFLKQHNIESMKKTMLMHEDIFKHQVRELHRLYSVQKTLMNKTRSEFIKQESMLYWVPMSMTTHGSDSSNYCSNIILNRHQPTTSGYQIHVQSVAENNIPSSQERSNGSCYGDETVMRSMLLPEGSLLFDLERPATTIEEEDISTDVSAIEKDQAGTKEINKIAEDGYDPHVELTLSIGGGNFKGKKELKSLHPEFRVSSAIIKSEEEYYSSVINSSTATLLDDDEQNKRPNWLFQGLSLNRTT
ncbi:Trigger factor like [Actinidia chinensis var. chinensis]|uniref:Trigger factor like n=1 Tax=Actinidia chinensis var. chinensis TaxID=1590841 RepID=A0A2R6P4L7_ACTCC|nr:Trigger factor like [Actinidia chinensis var. chinensis]